MLKVDTFFCLWFDSAYLSQCVSLHEQDQRAWCVSARKKQDRFYWKVYVQLVDLLKMLFLKSNRVDG